MELKGKALAKVRPGSRRVRSPNPRPSVWGQLSATCSTLASGKEELGAIGHRVEGYENKNQGAKKEAREETPAAKSRRGPAVVSFLFFFFKYFHFVVFFLSRWGMRAVSSKYKSRDRLVPGVRTIRPKE